MPMAASASIRPSLGRFLQGSNSRRPSLLLLPAAAAAAAAASVQAPPPAPWSGNSIPAVGNVALFSSSARALERLKPKNRDRSRLRGLSPLRRTGPREFLSVSNEAIPEPNHELPPVEVDPDHGLWDFFYDKKLLQTPEQTKLHGRSWTVEELRVKSWEDLHKLWWLCVKERNRIITSSHSRHHHQIGFGNQESQERDDVVRQTMKRIRHVLTERYYAWEDAVKLAENDPEIDLSGNGPAYRPQEYLEEEEEVVMMEAEPVEEELQEPASLQQKTTPESEVDPAPVDPSPKPSSQEQPKV